MSRAICKVKLRVFAKMVQKLGKKLAFEVNGYCCIEEDIVEKLNEEFVFRELLDDG